MSNQIITIDFKTF